MGVNSVKVNIKQRPLHLDTKFDNTDGTYLTIGHILQKSDVLCTVDKNGTLRAEFQTSSYAEIARPPKICTILINFDESAKMQKKKIEIFLKTSFEKKICKKKFKKNVKKFENTHPDYQVT